MAKTAELGQKLCTYYNKYSSFVKIIQGRGTQSKQADTGYKIGKTKRKQGFPPYLLALCLDADVFVR